MTHDALGIAARVATGEVSGEEVLAAVLAKLACANADLGAVSRLLEPGAALPGPFVGVPFVVEDLMADCAGTPTTAGAGFFSNAPGVAQDSAAVARMRASGLRIVGRTKTSEFGIALTTEPRFGGPVHNPWNVGLSP